jgi:group I intron endonuclease
MTKRIRCVYRIDIGERFYIGSSTNYKKRIRSHYQVLKKNKHPNQILQRMYDKGHELKFHILYEDTDSLNNIQEIEQIFIDKHFEDVLCINMCEKVGGGAISKDPKESARKANITKRKNGYYDNIIFSEDHKKNMSLAAKERVSKNYNEHRDRIIKGREKRWKQYNKNFTLTDKFGVVHGPFKFIQDPEKTKLLCRDSVRKLLNGKRLNINGFTCQVSQNT